MAFGGEVKGQGRAYLTGNTTGDYIRIGLLGTGTAGMSLPMNYQSGLSDFFYGSNVLDNDAVTNIPTTIVSSRAISALNVVLSGADMFIQFRTPGNSNLAANTTTYFKLGSKPTLSGLGVPLLGLLGLAELQNINGVAYSGASNYVTGFGANPNNGSVAGTSITKLLIDKDGYWYAAVTPNAAYNSIRLNVAFPTDISVLDVNRELTTKVYNAFTIVAGNTCSSKPIFASPGEVTGINLNTAAIGLPINSLLTDPEKAINTNNADYSAITTGVANVGVASTISQTFHFDHLAAGNDAVTIRLGLTQALVDLNLLGNGVKFKIYNNETQIGTIQTLSDNLLGLNLLDLISLDGGYKQADVTIKPTVSSPFNKIVIEYNTGLVNANVLGDALRIYDINLTSAVPTFSGAISDNAAICTGQNALLKAITDPSNELLWYDTIDGSMILGTVEYNIAFTTPILNNTTSSPVVKTYYVAAKKTGCAEASKRVPVKVIINPKPPHPSMQVSSH